MKVTLLEIYSQKPQYINKDVVGEYGMVAEIGKSFLARMIERNKKKSVNMPVFSLAYLAAILKKNGHQVDYKFNVLPQDADLVIIPSSIVDYKYELEFARKIKEKTKAKVGFFGPFASYLRQSYLEAADFVINGEPESVVSQITGDYIPDGLVSGELIKDLDTLPFPDWEIFPRDHYCYAPNLKKKPFIPVLASRGCIFDCLYCPHKAYYGVLRLRKPEAVVEELEYLKEKFNVRSVQFRDSIFTANRQNTSAIIDGIIKNNLDIEWGCETHVSCLDRELIDRMHQAGLRSINLGIESFDVNLLKNASRFSATKEKEGDIINYCHKKGIKVAAFYIFGMPGETQRTISDTVKYAKKLNTLVAQFFIFTPFPGTVFYEKLKDKIITDDWERFTSFDLVFEHDNLSRDEILKLKEKAFVSYYFRPAYFFKHLRHII